MNKDIKNEIINRSIKVNEIMAILDYHVFMLDTILNLRELPEMRKCKSFTSLIKADYFRLCILDLANLIDNDKKSASLLRLLRILEQRQKELYPSMTEDIKKKYFKVILDCQRYIENSDIAKRVKELRDTNISHFDYESKGNITENEIIKFMIDLKKFCNELLDVCPELMFTQANPRTIPVKTFIDTLYNLNNKKTPR